MTKEEFIEKAMKDSQRLFEEFSQRHKEVTFPTEDAEYCYSVGVNVAMSIVIQNTVAICNSHGELIERLNWFINHLREDTCDAFIQQEATRQ